MITELFKGLLTLAAIIIMYANVVYWGAFIARIGWESGKPKTEYKREDNEAV